MLASVGLAAAPFNPDHALIYLVEAVAAVLPEHWTGWVGRPGLRGSRGGADWSPQFTSTAVRLNGTPIPSGAEGPAVVHADGPAVVEVDAVDAIARLGLTVTVELTAGGLVRMRAALTNHGEPYQLDDLVLAFPVPPSPARSSTSPAAGARSGPRNAES